MQDIRGMPWWRAMALVALVMNCWCARGQFLATGPAGAPLRGTFYSAQRADYPPLPFNPFPDLSLTLLAPGRYV